MKKLKRLIAVFVLAVVTCVALVASAHEARSEKKPAKEKPILSRLCNVVPFFCSVSARSGNGDGEEPPRPVKR
jgi:hypothetical protein